MTIRSSCWESGVAFPPQNQSSVAVPAGAEEREEPEVPRGAGRALRGFWQLPGRSHLGAVEAAALRNVPVPGCMEAIGARHH